jgi:hypothetical protein
MFAADRMQDACHKLLRLLRKVRRFITNPLRGDLTRNADHPFAYGGEFHCCGGTNCGAVMRTEQRVSKRAIVPSGTVPALAVASRQDLIAQALRKPLRRGSCHVCRCPQFISVHLNAHLGKFGNTLGLRNRRLGVQSTDRPRRQRQLAARRRRTAAPRRSVVCRDTQLWHANEGIHRFVQQLRDSVEACGKITRALLATAKGSCDQRE